EDLAEVTGEAESADVGAGMNAVRGREDGGGARVGLEHARERALEPIRGAFAGARRGTDHAGPERLRQDETVAGSRAALRPRRSLGDAAEHREADREALARDGVTADEARTDAGD